MDVCSGDRVPPRKQEPELQKAVTSLNTALSKQSTDAKQASSSAGAGASGKIALRVYARVFVRACVQRCYP
jgi:hypothetical protein